MSDIWDGVTERRDLRRAAKKSLSCLDDALAQNNLTNGERAVMSALREFILEQWIPHLESAEPRMTQFDEIYRIARHLDTWMVGICWIVKRGLPGIAAVAAAAYAAGSIGVKMGWW